jgi:Acetyltransferase (GNAT) domain
MAALLGDPHVMQYYPRPKTREEAQAWIDWNKRNYADYGFGLCRTSEVGRHVLKRKTRV